MPLLRQEILSESNSARSQLSLPTPCLESHSQANLRPARIRTIGAARRRAPRSVGWDVAEHAGGGIQTIFIRAAAGVVRRIEEVERLESQIPSHSLAKWQLFRQPRIYTVNRVQIQIVHRLEWNSAESTAQTVERSRDQCPGKRVAANISRGIHGLRRLQSSDRTELPVVHEVARQAARAGGKRRTPHEVNHHSMTDIV